MKNKYPRSLRKAIIAAGVVASLSLAACDADQTVAAVTSALSSSSSNNQSSGANGTTGASQGKAAGELVDIESQIKNVSHVGDDEWDSADAQDAEINDGAVTITAAGVYRISGEVPKGVTVNAPKDAVVVLILDNATITNSSGAAINVVQADDVVLALEGTSTVTATGIADDADANAAIYSDADLTITGSGSVNVSSDNDGITSKDDLYVLSGTLNVEATDDGLRGKDSLTVAGGNITVRAAEGHALKSDKDDDVLKGLVHITGGTLDLSAAKDGINAFNTAQIDGGDITMAVGDDGVHAEVATVVNGGKLRITESVEGLEGGLVTVAGGEIDIVSSDDAINASGSLTFEDAIAEAAAEATQDTTATQSAPTPGMGGMEESTGEQLLISGGTIVLDAEGDGIDSNGDLLISGGDITVYGPTTAADGAMDAAGTFEITGGTLLAIGAAGMAQGPSSNTGEQDNAQSFVMTNVNVASGQEIVIKDAAGQEIASYTAKKDAGNVLFSSQDIISGESYIIAIDGVETEVTAGQATGGMGPGGMGQGGMQPPSGMGQGGMQPPSGMGQGGMQPPAQPGQQN